MEGQARTKDIKLIRVFKGKDITLQMDQMRTIQILLNLISNAIKFSPENG
jgi:signal transduction histidine kinase